MTEKQDAEAAKEAAESSKEEKAGGSSKKLLFIIIGVVVLIGGGVGAAFGLGLFSGEPPAEEGAEAESTEKTAPAPVAEVGPMVQLKPFIVNLADVEQDRYLKVTVELELRDEEVKISCDKQIARIQDILISLFSSKQFEQVRDIKGKIKLRQEIVIRINEVLGDKAVNHVYFTEFIVQ
jgi:flagellar FliL protein